MTRLHNTSSHKSGEQGYFVRSTRTVTRLAKMVRSTRPEAILLSDHLSAPHVLSFLGACVRSMHLLLVPRRPRPAVMDTSVVRPNIYPCRLLLTD